MERLAKIRTSYPRENGNNGWPCVAASRKLPTTENFHFQVRDVRRRRPQIFYNIIYLYSYNNFRVRPRPRLRGIPRYNIRVCTNAGRVCAAAPGPADAVPVAAAVTCASDPHACARPPGRRSPTDPPATDGPCASFPPSRTAKSSPTPCAAPPSPSSLPPRTVDKVWLAGPVRVLQTSRPRATD